MELFLRVPAATAPTPSHYHQLKNLVPLPSPPLLFISNVKLTCHSLTRLANEARGPVAASCSSSSPAEAPGTPPPPAPPRTKCLVVMEPPHPSNPSKAEVIDYYVETLTRVLGSEKDAQMCIYHASWQGQYGFCCDIDEEASFDLSRLPGVLSVKPDEVPEFDKKNYGYSDSFLNQLSNSVTHFSKFSSSNGSSEYWLVRMEKPGVEVVTKAQMVDYYAQTLAKVIGNEKDAQVSIYNISWEKDFGFCCHIDEECAQELADVPGVVSVWPDVNFDSDFKDYRGGNKLSNSKNWDGSSGANDKPEVKTKRLFVTGLSFYTSEKTLRAAFEPFGQLVEVKIIMDKISKRSKGYAFIEYSTEEAGGAALKEMNGKIINGWMIVVDVAKTNPPKYGRGRSQSTSSASSY